MPGKSLWLILIVGLGAISGSHLRSECPRPGRGWRAFDPSSIHHVVVLGVTATRDGRLVWFGSDVSATRLAEYLRRAQAMQPTPHFLLRYERGLTCGAVERLRRIFEEQVGCGVRAGCSDLAVGGG